jgi:uncharacterized protein
MVESRGVAQGGTSASCVTQELKEASMTTQTYQTIERHMLDSMRDSAHDAQHIYRVLRQALRIAESYPEANRDELVAACLLHDIGRKLQYENPKLCHAAEGGKMAYAFLLGLGWEDALCTHVRDCVTTHRFRSENPPATIEAKILFDSDKLDATGAMGIARSLIYQGIVGEPLYTVDEAGNMQDGKDKDAPESFIKEYYFKLKKVYKRFYTPEATAIAEKRRKITKKFYEALVEEITGED